MKIRIVILERRDWICEISCISIKRSSGCLLAVLHRGTNFFVDLHTKDVAWVFQRQGAEKELLPIKLVACWGIIAEIHLKASFCDLLGRLGNPRVKMCIIIVRELGYFRAFYQGRGNCYLHYKNMIKDGMFFVGQWQKWKQKSSVLRHTQESLWVMPFNFLGKEIPKGKHLFPILLCR